MRRLPALLALVVALPTATAGAVTVPAGDADALRDAITEANDNGVADVLNESGTYEFTAADNWWYGPNALPAISSDVAIVGDPVSGARIVADNPTRLRLFYVANDRSGLSAGRLRLEDLEVSGGIARGGSSGVGGGGAGLGARSTTRARSCWTG